MESEWSTYNEWKLQPQNVFSTIAFDTKVMSVSVCVCVFMFVQRLQTLAIYRRWTMDFMNMDRFPGYLNIFLSLYQRSTVYVCIVCMCVCVTNRSIDCFFSISILLHCDMMNRNKWISVDDDDDDEIVHYTHLFHSVFNNQQTRRQQRFSIRQSSSLLSSSAWKPMLVIGNQRIVLRPKKKLYFLWLNNINLPVLCSWYDACEQKIITWLHWISNHTHITQSFCIIIKKNGYMWLLFFHNRFSINSFINHTIIFASNFN